MGGVIQLVMKINLTIPVFNEETKLNSCVKRVHALVGSMPEHDFDIVVANNGSTDATARVAHDLCDKFGGTRLINIEKKGRGRALKSAWMESEAEILSYMDVDLSTDLDAYPALIGPLVRGQAELAVGSRLHPDSRTTRGLKRELISRLYNKIVQLMFNINICDVQCGFKAVTKSVVDRLLPKIQDDYWFFDTELLVLAEKYNVRIIELPVAWTENLDSRVDILRTAIADVRGLVRLRRAMRSR